MKRKLALWFTACLVGLGFPIPAHAQGIYLPGAGANQLSMGGASTALATDAAGALYWNPAAISGLPVSEAMIGGDLIRPYDYLDATLPKKALGKLPTTTIWDNTYSDSALQALPTIAVVYNDNETFAYGLGATTVASQKTNYTSDPANPLLSSQSPLRQFVTGPESSSLMILQITPTVSAQVTENLAIGVSPTIDIASVSFSPAFFGPTTQASKKATPQFPTGAPAESFAGAGVRVGATYRVCSGIVAGASYTSPQWFQPWRFNGTGAAGEAVNYQTAFSLPAIYSAGLAFDGLEGWVIAADVHYFDYAGTSLLGTSTQDMGAGWRSIASIAVGARRQVTKNLSLQAGYIYSQDPLPQSLTLFNVQLPALTEHTVTVGAFYEFNDHFGISLAYLHGFHNYIISPLPQAIGASATIESSYDSIALSLHYRFGARVDQ